MPTCQRQQCGITTKTQPQESSPEHPPPSAASLAGRNQRLPSHKMPLPAPAAPAAGSRLKLLAEAAAALPQQPSVTRQLLGQHCWFSAHRPPECLWAQRNNLLWCKSIPKTLSWFPALPYPPKNTYFLEAQSIIIETTPRLPDSSAESEGQVAAI